MHKLVGNPVPSRLLAGHWLSLQRVCSYEGWKCAIEFYLVFS